MCAYLLDRKVVEWPRVLHEIALSIALQLHSNFSLTYSRPNYFGIPKSIVLRDICKRNLNQRISKITPFRSFCFIWVFFFFCVCFSHNPKIHSPGSKKYLF